MEISGPEREGRVEGRKEEIMTEIRQLEIKISGYQEKIRELEAEIGKLEQNYESLRIFKGSVETSQGEFNDINSQRKNILTELGSIEAHSMTAQRYYDGMNGILNGIVSRIIGCVYPALLFEISIRMQKYSNDITDCEAEISRYRHIIGNLDEELYETKAKKNKQNGETR